MRAARTATICGLAFAVLGCAGGPALAARVVPDWVLTPPASTPLVEYFVVSASSRTSAAEAEEAAGFVLLNQINQALGVEITMVTNAEARASLDSFEADLVQQVTQRGSGQIQGLRIGDRYITEQGEEILVYVLGEYERDAFEAERHRRQSILRQEEDLLAEPERQGDLLVAEGRITQGLLQYAQGAAAASASALEAAPIVLQRVLRKAGEAAARLQLAAISGPAHVQTGEPVPPIAFALTDDRGSPVPGAGIELSYSERRGNRDVLRTVSMLTNELGVAAFRHPDPERVGEFAVTARLDADAVLSLLRELPGQYSDQAASVSTSIVNVRSTHRFSVLSAARTIPTAILVEDVDETGRTAGTRRAAGGIVEYLVGNGFAVQLLDARAQDVEQLSLQAAADFVRSRTASDVTRLVVGRAEIVEIRPDDGFIVRISGSVRVFDLDTGLILYEANSVKNTRSQTAERATAIGLTEIGRQLGEDLASHLP